MDRTSSFQKETVVRPALTVTQLTFVYYFCTRTWRRPIRTIFCVL